MGIISSALNHKYEEMGYYEETHKSNNEVIAELQKENEKLRKEYSELLGKYNSLCKKLANNEDYIKLRLQRQIWQLNHSQLPLYF